jgi:nucleotide-binding universal stress UspA family protein
MIALRTILVPHDFSPHADAALRRASGFAQATRARIHLLHACALPVGGLMPHEMVVPAGVWDAIRTGAEERLEEVRRRLVQQGVDASAEVSSRLPVDAILESADKTRADLIVMGTYGRAGLKHALLGSVAERTLRLAPCPVISVKKGDAGALPRRILVATDFSETGEHAREVGSKVAQQFGAEVHLVHALDVLPSLVGAYGVTPPETLVAEARENADKRLDAALEALRAGGVRATGHLTEAPAAPAIARIAGAVEADLLVIGTHGYTGLRHALLGSVAERTLRLVRCAVLTVKVSDSQLRDMRV